MTGNLPSLTYEPTRHPGCCLSFSEPLLATIRTLLDSVPHIYNNKSADEYKPEPGSEPALILSIGSGTGLLEELLHVYLNRQDRASANSAPTKKWRVEGVEVSPAVNIYLPEDRIYHVQGTWAVLETRAREASALMFVYPRDGALVRRYIDVFKTSSMRARGQRGHEVNREAEVDRENDGANGSAVASSNPRANEENNANHGDETGRNPHEGVPLVLWLGPKCDWDHTGLALAHTNDDFEVLEMHHDVGLAEYEMLAALRQKTTLL